MLSAQALATQRKTQGVGQLEERGELLRRLNKAKLISNLGKYL